MTRPEGKTGPIAGAVMDDIRAATADVDYSGEHWYGHLPDGFDGPPIHPQSFRGDKYLHAGVPDNADFHRMRWNMRDEHSPRVRADLERVMTDLWRSPLQRIALAAAERRLARITRYDDFSGDTR